MVRAPERMVRAPDRPIEVLEEAAVLTPPPKKRTRWPFLLIALLGIAGIAILAFFLLRGEGATGPEIKTPEGTFLVSDVPTSDRYPEDCIQGPGCWVATSGYKVLTVEFTRKGGDDWQGMGLGSEAYIVSSDGDRTESSLFGFNMGEGDERVATLGFTPEASDHDFTLHVADNPPVELER